MVEFINLFLTYFVLLVIMASIAALGIYWGKVLHEKVKGRKELKAMKAEGESEQSEE